MLSARITIIVLLVAITGSCNREPDRETTPITVVDIDGNPWSPTEVSDQRAHCILFITLDCPIANAYAPEIGRIIRQYAPRGVQFFLAHVDPAATPGLIRKHMEDYGYDGLTQTPVILDHGQDLARATGATITPEAALLTPDGLAYRGRIDNLFADLGKKRRAATEKDLRAALDSVLNGGRPDPARTEAVGCYLPEK